MNLEPPKAKCAQRREGSKNAAVWLDVYRWHLYKIECPICVTFKLCKHHFLQNIGQNGHCRFASPEKLFQASCFRFPPHHSSYVIICSHLQQKQKTIQKRWSKPQQFRTQHKWGAACHRWWTRPQDLNICGLSTGWTLGNLQRAVVSRLWLLLPCHWRSCL